MKFKYFVEILLIAGTIFVVNCRQQLHQNEKIEKIVNDIYESIEYMYHESFLNEFKQKISEYVDELKKVSSVIDPSSQIEGEKFLKEVIPKFNDIKREIAKQKYISDDITNYAILFGFVNETRPNFQTFEYKNWQDEKIKRQYRFFIERVPTTFDLNQYRLGRFVQALEYREDKHPPLDKYINMEPEEYKELWMKQRESTAIDNFIIYGMEDIILSVLKKYEHPSQILDAKYSTENYFEKVKTVMEELRPFYSQLHAYVRRALREKYGREIVSDRGPIPHHFVEQLQLKSKNQQANFDYPFTEKGFPLVVDPLKRNLSIKDVAKKCDKFYQSIGFSDLPEIFWENNFKTVHTEDINILFNTDEESFLHVSEDINFKTYLQMCTNLAKVHYDELTRHFPTSYMGEPYPGFTRSVGKAVKLSVLSPKYLEETRFLINSEIDDETNLNRLYRMAIQSMFGMSQFYVYEKFWYDFIDLKTKKNNCDYWKMENNFLGVESPAPRNGSNFDISQKFLSSGEYVLDLLLQDRFSPIFENILGFSIYKYVCQKSGEYIPGDEDHSLNKCNFHGNKQAGKFLISTLSSDPIEYWYEIFEKVYGDEVGLNASGLLEYFKPLIEWLEKENKKNNAFIGWKESSYECRAENIFTKH